MIHFISSCQSLQPPQPFDSSVSFELITPLWQSLIDLAHLLGIAQHLTLLVLLYGKIFLSSLDGVVPCNQRSGTLNSPDFSPDLSFSLSLIYASRDLI